MSKIDGGSSAAAIKAKQYMTNKQGSSVDRRGGQVDLPSSKHAKSKSQNKFS